MYWGEHVFKSGIPSAKLWRGCVRGEKMTMSKKREKVSVDEVHITEKSDRGCK